MRNLALFLALSVLSIMPPLVSAQESLDTFLVSFFDDAGELSASLGGTNQLTVAATSLLSNEFTGIDALYAKGTNEKMVFFSVKFTGRSNSTDVLTIRFRKPVVLTGIVKSVDFWEYHLRDQTCVQDYRLLVGDYLDIPYEVPYPPMSFTGLKKITCYIPDTIRQADYRISRRRGLTVYGIAFSLKGSPQDTVFFGLDLMTAVADVMLEQNPDPEDMKDRW